MPSMLRVSSRTFLPLVAPANVSIASGDNLSDDNHSINSGVGFSNILRDVGISRS